MTNNRKLVKQFEIKLRALTKKTCWGFAAGEGTGSVVALDFGKKIRRKEPIDNSYLNQQQRLYEAEMSLFVNCTWRLDSKNAVICGSTDPNIQGGPMLEGLAALVGKRIEAVKIQKPAFDMIVQFKGPLFLKIFCDQCNLTDRSHNYSFHLQKEIYIVGPKGEISYERR